MNIKNQRNLVVVDLAAEGLDDGAREALARRARNRIHRLKADLAIVHHCNPIMEEKMEHLNCFSQAGELFWNRSRYALLEQTPHGAVLKDLLLGEELKVLLDEEKLIYKGETLAPFAIEKKELHPAKQEGTFAKYIF